VSRIYSNLAIIDIKDKKLYVREMAPGVTYEYLAANTEAVLEPAEI
jgi:3-oxoadipate CoA-transferase beta subunit